MGSRRKYPEELTQALVKVDKLTPELMSDETAVQQWSETLIEVLRQNPDANPAVAVQFDPETNVYVPEVTLLLKGVSEKIALPLNFLSGPEYRAIAAMIDELHGLLEVGAFIQRGERRTNVEHFSEAFDWLQKEARRGVDLQRYKGLGEMNPEQLWETTMDQSVRRMLRVSVDDAIGADRMFTTLMGDHVEPRREFIEKNALSVVNLDV
jgi:DNA gyrase subunit B